MRTFYSGNFSFRFVLSLAWQIKPSLLFTGKLKQKSGAVSDKVSFSARRFPCYLGALLIELINPLFFCLFPVLPGGNRKALMIFLSACLGIGSGGCTCCLRSLVGAEQTRLFFTSHLSLYGNDQFTKTGSGTNE